MLFIQLQLLSRHSRIRVLNSYQVEAMEVAMLMIMVPTIELYLASWN